MPWFPRRAHRRLRLGVVANEFFDRAIGRMGGFGWAAAQVARCFGDDPSLGVDVTFFTGDVRARRSPADEVRTHGARLLLQNDEPYAPRVRREAPDLLLLIDFRPSYRPIVEAVSAPVILWSRDPRTPADVARIATLRIPGRPDVVPRGIAPVDCTSFGDLSREAEGRTAFRRRRMLVATTTPWLEPKVAATYGVAPSQIWDLPNIIPAPDATGPRSASPRVVFLGRLDPIKRPWIFVEVARRLPAVEFIVLGRACIAGEGTWQPADLPPNVRLVGHVGGAEKRELLASAWALVNTSIHESLAVSFLEALAVGTPIVSCQDAQGVATRFGVHVGRWDGDGLDSVPAFVGAVDGLCSDPGRQQRLGAEGQAWVRSTHSRATFLDSFLGLCREAGTPLRSPVAPQR